MKRYYVYITILVLAMSVFAFAQDDDDDYDLYPGRMYRGMMGQGMMHGGMMGQGMMYGMQGMSMMGMGDPVIMQLHHFGCPAFILALSDQLDLTEQQITDLKALRTDYQKYATRKKADLKIAKIELSELLDKVKPDFVKVREKVNQIAAMEKDMRLKFLNTIETSRGLLTDEQLKDMQTLDWPEKNGMNKKGMKKRGM